MFNDEPPPNVEGLMPPLWPLGTTHGTPKMGVGSSGGVTCNDIRFFARLGNGLNTTKYLWYDLRTTTWSSQVVSGKWKVTVMVREWEWKCLLFV